ncbi:hypothetical protein F5Y02DRAFT_429460 [Annulohypoxylon stygium]|nr:hypothetical protein F5Y02DRAFT_429460 [Annulohypoxylon stygium]
MRTLNYGFLTVGQQLLSPNSTGHTYNSQHPLYRCNSHSCKSAPAEQHGKENSREYEDEHCVFSPTPHRFQLRLATSGACSYCKTRRPPEGCRDRSLTSDDLISTWLSGVSRSDCLNDEANPIRQITPTTRSDSRSKLEVLSNSSCPKIVLQPTRRDRSTAQSGTGLDGPQSSESDQLSKLRDELSELKESSQSPNLSTSSPRPISNTSGSIGWEKNWEKRKPRRNDNNDTGSGSDSEGVLDNKSCAYVSQHDAQFHAVKKYALNSCPELHRQLIDFDKCLSGPQDRNSQEQIAQLRSELEKVRHRHHFHLRNVVTRGFQSLTRRLRRSGSTYSIRSEYTTRRNSKERRLLARESVDIWPSSGEESPLFNTPESNMAHADTPRAAGHHFDPLAMASMMIATAELDRLSSRASLEQKSMASGSSTGFSGNTPASPNDETSISESTALYSPPTIPYNTPTSSGLHSGVISPLSRPAHRQGHRRRGQRSHLSEVTTPDEVASPEESTEEFTGSRGSVSSSLIETLPECPAIPDCEYEGSLFPKPLVVDRDSREGAKTADPVILRDTRGGHRELKREGAISAPARVSSIGKTLEPTYDLKGTSKNDGQLLPSTSSKPEHSTESSTTDFSNLQATETPIEIYDRQKPPDSNVFQAATTSAFDKESRPESCHPDTCLYESASRPLGSVRQDTSETIRKVGVVQGDSSNKDSDVKETRERGE